MPRFDLYVTSLPDNKARMVLARLIIGSNRAISVQAALKMIGKPPLLLFGGLELNEAEQYINQLKSLSVGFKVTESKGGGSDSGSAGPKPGGMPDSDFSEFANISKHNVANKKSGKAQPLPPVNGESGKPKPAMPPPTYANRPAAPAHTPANPVGGYSPPLFSGVRISSLDEKNMKAAEDDARRKNLLVATVFAVFFIIFGVVILLFPQNNKFSVEKSGGIAVKEKNAPPAKAKKSKKARRGATAASDASASQNSKEKQRNAVNSQQKQQANAYIDSAKTSGGDMNRSVAFYKIAISFNRYNMSAWYGLLQAYRDMNMDKEAKETEEQMMAVFGDQIMDVNNIVSKSNGELVDSYVNDDGVYRIEYKTRKRSKDDILREVFDVTRLVRVICGCQTISIYATTGAGKGLIAHSARNASAHSFVEFSKQAKIVWLD